MYRIEYSNGSKACVSSPLIEEACERAEAYAIRYLECLYVIDSATEECVASFDGYAIASGTGLND